MHKLTENQLSVNWETQKHIDIVRKIIGKFAQELIGRGIEHDRSKLEKPEVAFFADFISQLKGLEYGSEEYKKCLDNLGPALEHHYGCNRHHPEYFENGISDMNLIDLVEMLCDWKAATLRHANGNLTDSLKVNKDRFKMDPQLVRILENTIDFMDQAGATQCSTY